MTAPRWTAPPLAALLIAGCACAGCSAQQAEPPSGPVASAGADRPADGEPERPDGEGEPDPVLDDESGFNGNSMGPEALGERPVGPDASPDAAPEEEHEDAEPAERALVKAAEAERLISALERQTRGDPRPYPSPAAAREAAARTAEWAAGQERGDYFEGYEVSGDGLAIRFETPSGAEVWYDFPAPAES